MSSVYPEDPFGDQKAPVKNPSPEPTTVNQFHARSDNDSSSFAQHHTLGIKANQASPGDHKHDGKNSKKLLEGVTITGSKGGNVALASVVDALERLGALDSTS